MIGPDRVGEVPQRPLDVLLRRRVAADRVGLDEAQLDALGQPARPLAPRQRIHLELQALRHAAVGLLLLRDLARLVVHDHRAQQIFVDAVEATAHARGADAEREILLDVRRLLAPSPQPALLCLCGGVVG